LHQRRSEEGIQHCPVLVDEVLTGLNVQPGGCFIDGTLGGGGHTQLLLRHTRVTGANGVGNGRILGLDVDPAAIQRVRERFPDEISAGRLQLSQGPFDQIARVARQRGFAGVDGILLDLGLSSFQLDTPARGFAFQHDGPLDMRFDPSTGDSAAELINNSTGVEIADILYQYGEERASRAIARAIVASRPVTTTAELANIVTKAVGRRGWQKIHPATRTFQALRIAVNDELGQLERALPQIPGLLRDGGRVAIIAFHSLEDRLVKRWMRDHARRFRPDPTLPTGGQEQIPALSIYNKKPIVPAAAEIERNPRSRSARLRIAEKRSEP
jgi:16S rRNA (cytosine1402-N4)-methyltransferase